MAIQHACYNRYMSAIVTVDIGGTQIRAAVYSKEDTQPITVVRVPTLATKAGVFDRLVHLLQEIWPDNSVAALSLGVAGPLDPETGVVIEASNIPEWNGFPLRNRLDQIFQAPIYLGNDANLAALGEWKFGAGRGHHHLLYITVSTGIGGGVIIADHLLEGSRGLAAELGHVTCLPDGPICSCGARGHLEALSSGTAIARYITEQIANGQTSVLSQEKDITSHLAAIAASNGDHLSIDAFNRAGKYLGQAVAGFLHIFNPTIIIFGGGVSQAGDLLFNPMRKSMRESLMTPVYMENLILTTAQLGDDVGLLGALALARINLGI